MESAYELLIRKVDQFIRKYYLNKMVRGVLYWTGLVLSVFLLLTLTEFRAYLTPGIKIPLVALAIALIAGTAVWWIALPLLSFLKLGKRISHEQAAGFIGQHFPTVQDKLLNILQLKERSVDSDSRELVIASIQQKSEEIKLVPFSGAIDLRLNRRYLRYALPPLLVLLALFFGSPNVIRDGTKRLAKPAQHFEREAPFTFLVSYPEDVIQYGAAQIDVQLEGKVLPAEVYLMKDGKPYKMAAEKKNAFSYTVLNIAEGFDFVIEAEGFRTVPYHLSIIPKPTLLEAQLELRYPPYTGKQPEILKNVGEISVPVGTQAVWKFNAKNTTAFAAVSDGGAPEALEEKKGHFEYQRRLLQNGPITFFLSNEALQNADSVGYYIDIIPDKYPTITAEKITDSTNSSYMYFIGEYTDDYGISDLRFHYSLQRADKSLRDSSGTERISFERNSTIGRYSMAANAEEFRLGPGDRVEYFFEVKDNDAIHGAKSARSRVFAYKKPTVEEFKEKETENNKEIKQDLADAMKKVEEFSKEVKALKEEQLDKKSISWEDKKKLEDLMKRHDELNKAMQKMQKNFEENLKNQEEFKKVDEEILEKQEKLEELMEELLTDEMKELMEKIREMMDELNMEEMLQGMEDFEMNSEELEDQLDRMLELFKKLEFEQKMQDMINDLEELAKEQNDLGEESKQKDADSEEILEKQKEINEKFEEIRKDLEELGELNKEQTKPQDLGELGDKAEEVTEDMEQGTEQLEQQQPAKAGEKQKSAGQKMKEMAQKMQGMMSTMAEMQASEDLEALRQLLENLVKLSFDEEMLFEEVKRTEVEQPKFRELVQQQYKLKDDAAMIEDSLVALSKRVFQLESFITDELHKMNREIRQSIDNMEERRKGPAVANQQFIMTSANNLALMLSEVMEQMQEAMAKAMPGNQQCEKPGGKGSLPTMQQLQKQLGEDMKQMKDAMEKGKSPGGQQLSKEFARMAAQQAALREALRKMKENMSQGEKSGGNVDQLMEKMDETETDLLNKRITQETLKRQEEIITNLLKMETAEREQDKEEKRESTTAKNVQPKLPPEVAEYLKERQSTIEIYRTVPPTLTPFYKKLVEKYFKSVN